MTSGALLSLFGGLAAVLGFMALLVAGARRLRGIPATRSGRRLRVGDRAGLGQRQGVAVVEVDGRRLLVGYGEGGVRYLTELDADDVALPGEMAVVGDEDDAPAGAGLFSLPFRPPLSWHRVARRFGITALWLLTVALAATPANVSAASLVEAGPGLLTEALATDGTDEGGIPLEAPLARDAAATVQQTPTPGRSGTGDPAERLLRSRLPDLELSLGREDGEGLQVSGPVGIVLFMGFLTLLPTLLLLTTSFTRILVVLHLLKQALGTQTAPPGHLVAALALLLTGFVMAPTLAEANRVGVEPWVQGEVDEVTMIREASVPFRDFMVSNMRREDLETFMRMARTGPVETVDQVPMVVVMTAFVTSELRAAFQMGFALFLPFVVIDLVVASVLMSMGMFMLPPVMVSLPFKLLLFVMVDGWALVMEGIVRSFPY